MDEIAIIGMSCLYPDYVTREDFWDRMVAGLSFTATDRFMGRDIERASMPRDRADEFFRARFRPEEMAQMDDMGDLFKWTTYITREALREAGYLEKFQPLSRTGLVMGVFGMPAWEYTHFFDDLVRLSTQQTINFLMGGESFEFDYQTQKRLQPRAIQLDTEPSIFVAEKFRLGGPVTNLNVACSTPVYAMQLASMYLLQGKADMMLAGAQCYNQMDLAISGLFDLLGILAGPGENKPFDKNSKGVIAGSGAGMFLLKRLSDARRDGDAILGIIERIGWSNDGGRRSILAPDADGQILSYEDAYRADLSPDVDYIECHATGTVAGDWTEIDSITRYFRSRGVDPLLGALKGNTGHFFTASTHAAIAKVLLAMQKGLIPLTSRIENPIDPRIVTQNTPWPDRGRAKRAAVNSFGFGGTNAHLVLREYSPSEPISEPIRRQSYAYVPMDITGLGMVIGEIESVGDYIRLLCQGRSAVQEVRKIRWHALQQHPELLREMHLTAMPRGAYICEFDFDFMDYKFPVSGNEYWLRKDFLLLKATDEAIRDAGLSRGENPRTSVIINFGQDFSEMNFMASLELRDVIMPALEKNYPDLTSEQLEELWAILRENELRRDAAGTVPGMMPNIRASRVAARWGFHGPTMAIADRENGFARALEIAQYLLAENMVDHVVVGSAELVGEQEHIYVQELLGNIDAIRTLGIGEGAVALVLSRAGESDAPYAQVGGVSITRPVGDTQARIRMGISDALLQADIGKDEIGIVELPESAQPEMREAYFELFRAGFFGNPRAVWDSVERSTGFAMSLTGGIALIKAALEISGGVRFVERAAKREPWGDPIRAALVNSFSRDGSAAHVALREAAESGAPRRLRPESFLLPVYAQTPEQLMEKLGQLRQAVSKKGPSASFRAAWDAPREALCLCLIARDKESLLDEIDQALKRADAFSQPGYLYESGRGSYFAASPIGPRGKIVYMCPPGGMWNSSRFFEALSRFPDLRRFYLDFAQGDFMARSDVRGQRLEAFMMELPAARLAVDILKKLTIAPDMVVGASMGELAPLFALDSIEYDAPNTLGTLIAELTQVLSDLFGRELPTWESFYIKGDQAELTKILESEPDVHRIILGSPMDSVILGEREACRRLLARFSGLGTRAEDVTVIHTPLANPLYGCCGGEAFGRKIRLKADLPYAMYTTRDRAPMRPGDPDAFARSFRHILTEPSDFSDTLQAAYEDGGRVFIDLSTGGVCQAWAAEALRGRDALIVPLYPSAAAPETHFLKLLGRLMAHGVLVDASRAAEMFAFQVSDRPRLVRKVPMSIQGSIDRISDPVNRERVMRAGRAADAQARSVESREGSKGAPAEAPRGDPAARSEALSQETQGMRNGMNAAQSPNHAAAVGAIAKPAGLPGNAPADSTPNAQRAGSLLEQTVPAALDTAAAVAQTAPASPESLADYGFALDILFRARALQANARAYDLYTRYERELLAALLRAAPEGSDGVPAARPCLWDLSDILEMTAGSMARVLGPRYAAVDRYRVRARLPMPPFLFVSRITAIDAEYGVYRPSSIDIEYDIQEDCLLTMGSMISHIVITESAQIGIFLMAYIGIDDLSEGTLRFRIADTKATIHGDIPGVGETFQGRYQILSFMKNGATTLVTSRFTCTVNGRPVLTLDAIGGFFTEQDLENSKGVIEKNGAPRGVPASRALRLPQNEVTSYTKEELRPFYSGEFTGYAPKGQVISPDHFFAVRPLSDKVFLVDRVERITSSGGKYGLGEIIAHKDIDETHWAFQVHFLNDPVYPGSLLLEAVNQLAYFFLLHTGLIARTKGGVAYPRRGSPVSCAFRGQVRPVPSTITYRLAIRDFVDEPGNVYFAYDADIYWQGIHVVKGENLSVCIEGE